MILRMIDSDRTADLLLRSLVRTKCSHQQKMPNKLYGMLETRARGPAENVLATSCLQ